MRDRKFYVSACRKFGDKPETHPDPNFNDDEKYPDKPDKTVKEIKELSNMTFRVLNMANYHKKSKIGKFAESAKSLFVSAKDKSPMRSIIMRQQRGHPAQNN